MPTMEDRRFAHLDAINWSYVLLLFLLFAWLPGCLGQTEIRPAEPRVAVSNAIQKLAAALAATPSKLVRTLAAVRDQKQAAVA